MTKYPILNTQYRNLPSSPGVYFFRDKSGKLLYIGKAINLKRRVSSYFQSAGPLRYSSSEASGRTGCDTKTEELVNQISKIDWRETDSAIEALILEANLVKKYQPFYNIKLKDDKTFVNIAISDEEFPRIFVIRPKIKGLYPHTYTRSADRQRRLSNLSAGVYKKIKIKKLFGPYTSAKTARTALKILRRIFPFRGLEKTRQAERFYKEILEIPENRENYLESIKSLALFFQGKKKRLINNLTKRMEEAARLGNYEEAAKTRDKIFALKHIQDVALLKGNEWAEEIKKTAVPARIEAYDISNIFGQYATGSMVVFTDGKIDKDEYRHFRIRQVRGISDTAMLAEVLERRFRHPEWKTPDLLIIDGGLGQLNAIKKVLVKYELNIPLISVAKGPTRKGEKLFMTKSAPYLDKKIILALRDEAHRFAISYHRKLKRISVFKAKQGLCENSF